MTVNTETHRESVAVDCLALNEDSYITSLPETQGTSHKGRGQKDDKSQGLGRTVGKQCLLDVTHELTAAMVALVYDFAESLSIQITASSSE